MSKNNDDLRPSMGLKLHLTAAIYARQSQGSCTELSSCEVQFDICKSAWAAQGSSLTRSSIDESESSGVKKLKRTFLPTNLEFTSIDQVGLQFEDKSYVKDRTRKSQLCKSSTFQNRVRCPYFQTLRTPIGISRRVRHGELYFKQRYCPLESDVLEAEVYCLGFCRFIRPVYSLCFTVFKKPANF